MLIDTHCHLDFPALSGQLDELLKEARAAGISRWVVPGVQPEHWPRITALCRRVPEALPAYGIHPCYAASATEGDLSVLSQLAPEGVAIGEIGMDRLGQNIPRQEIVFRQQLQIAVLHGRPVLIHCRGMIGRVLQIIREERVERVGGIMHAFSGSVESARECIRLGFAISISGTITWEGAIRPLLLARELPLDQLVVESDAPDQIPRLHRGALYSRPVWLQQTVAMLAALRGITVEAVTDASAATAQRILKISQSSMTTV